MKLQEAIKKAEEAGWQHDGSKPYAWAYIVLDPLFWKSLGKAMGWEQSKYRLCEMKMPFYNRERLRGIGVIVGESKDGKQWYVRWDKTMNGKPSKNGGVRQPYPKQNIIEKSTADNWKMVLHRFIDHLAEGKTAESFFEMLT